MCADHIADVVSVTIKGVRFIAEFNGIITSLSVGDVRIVPSRRHNYFLVHIRYNENGISGDIQNLHTTQILIDFLCFDLMFLVTLW